VLIKHTQYRLVFSGTATKESLHWTAAVDH